MPETFKSFRHVFGKATKSEYCNTLLYDFSSITINKNDILIYSNKKETFLMKNGDVVGRVDIEKD